MNSQLEIKLAPTPETDAELNYRSYGFFCTMGGLPAEAVGADFARELERERDQFSKTLGEVREILCDALPNENQLTSFMAATLVRERDEAQETIATMEIRHAAVMLHTQSIVDDANQCREQRDRLAAALRKLADCDWVITPHDRMDAVREIARKALQSLTPNEKQ